MIVDKYLKNFGNNQVFAVVHSRVIWRSFLPIFIELCMKTPCLCPSEGHKHGCRNRNIWVVLLKRSLVTLELWDVEINISSISQIVQLAKTKAITHFFDSRNSLLGQPLKSRNVKAWKFKCALLQNEEPYRAKTLSTPCSYRVYNPMKLKPQKERSVNYRVVRMTCEMQSKRSWHWIRLH